MPTHEPVQNTIIPKEPEKPIPVRTVQTRARPLPVRTETENSGQQTINSSPAAESATTEESVRLSPQLSALAKKEQVFRQREQALKDREKALEEKLGKADKYEALQSKMSAKDFSEAEALGLNYEEYTKYKLDQQNGEDPQAAEIRALRDEVRALKEGSEEQAAALYSETVAEYKKEISKIVAENPDFSSVKALKREDAVLQLILDSFEEDGEELTVMEATQLVEEKLLEYGNTFTALPKFKKADEPKVLPRPIVGKTLTNNMTVEATGAQRKPLYSLPDNERYAEARRRALEKRKG